MYASLSVTFFIDPELECYITTRLSNVESGWWFAPLLQTSIPLISFLTDQFSPLSMISSRRSLWHVHINLSRLIPLLTMNRNYLNCILQPIDNCSTMIWNIYWRECWICYVESGIYRRLTRNLEPPGLHLVSRVWTVTVIVTSLLGLRTINPLMYE